MNALTFILKSAPAQQVDVSPLVPAKLSTLSRAEIGAIALRTGNRRVRTDVLFEIAGRDASQVVFLGQTHKLDGVGKNLCGGQILVKGSCGAYAGMGMSDGQIKIQGNSGAFTACEMRGGLLRIGGHSGDFLASARPGHRIGMVGGTVIVTGNTGDRAGDHMRRGTVLIEGNAGAYLGSQMLAGTIAVLGKADIYPGYGMKRGTLLLWEAPARLSATFNESGACTLSFLPLLLRSFQGLETRFSALTRTSYRVRRYCGDMASLGRGEILIWV